MKEKILLPAAQRARGGEARAVAAKLRLHHGAIAALLVPTPTKAIVAALRAILGEHDEIEEGPGGTYDVCDDLLAAPILPPSPIFPPAARRSNSGDLRACVALLPG